MFESDVLKSHEKIFLEIEKNANQPKNLFEALFDSNGQAKDFVLKGLTLFTADKIFELLDKESAVLVGNNWALRKAMSERFAQNPLSKIVFMMQAKKASHYLSLSHNSIPTIDQYSDDELRIILQNKKMLEYLIQNHLYFFSDCSLCVLIALVHPEFFSLILNKVSFSDHLIVDSAFIEFIFKNIFKEIDFYDFLEKYPNWKEDILSNVVSRTYDPHGNFVSVRNEIGIKNLPLKDVLHFIHPLCDKIRDMPETIFNLWRSSKNGLYDYNFKERRVANAQGDSILCAGVKKALCESFHLNYDCQVLLLEEIRKLGLNNLHRFLLSPPASWTKYLVVLGDTYSIIANKIYGSEEFADYIAQMNGCRQEEQLFPGQILSIKNHDMIVEDIVITSSIIYLCEKNEDETADYLVDFYKLVKFYFFPLLEVNLYNLKLLFKEIEGTKKPIEQLFCAFLLKCAVENHLLDANFPNETAEYMLLDALALISKIFEIQDHNCRESARELLSHIQLIYGLEFPRVNKYCNQIKFFLGESFSMENFCNSVGFFKGVFKPLSSQIPLIDLPKEISLNPQRKTN